MKGPSPGLFQFWRKVIILCSIGLAACNDPVNLYQPVDISRVGETARFDVDIKKAGSYQFALLFAAGYTWHNRDKTERQTEEIYAHYQDNKQDIPLLLCLMKEGRIIEKRKINSKGERNSWRIIYGERTISIHLRNEHPVELASGHYSVFIITLEAMPDFKGIQTFISIEQAQGNG